MQNGQFGSKIKNAKNMRKTILQDYKSSSVQKTLEKTSNIREMRQFWKSVILQRLQPLENGQSGSKIKNAKNMRKTILQDYKSCSVKKKTLEKTPNIREMRHF